MNTTEVQLYVVNKNYEVQNFLTTDLESYEVLKKVNLKYLLKDSKFIIATGIGWSQTMTNTYHYYFYETLNLSFKPVRKKGIGLSLTNFRNVEGWIERWAYKVLPLWFKGTNSDEFKLCIPMDFNQTKNIKKLAAILRFVEKKQSLSEDEKNFLEKMQIE